MKRRKLLYIGIQAEDTPVDERNYLCLTSTGNSTFALLKADTSNLSTAGTFASDNTQLYVSLDGKRTFNAWDGSAISLADSQQAYIYATNWEFDHDGSQGDAYHRVFFLTGSIAASGDVTTLLDRDATTTLAQAYCFDSLFKGCTSLTSAPELNATTLSVGCYQSMFWNSNIATAPTLPALEMKDSCYRGMFRGCIFVTPPELVATTLATACYRDMFLVCYRMTTAPTLSATTMENQCYMGMFNGCTSLVTPPTLNSTSLANNCYGQMFKGCTALVTPPALPATTLAQNCYNEMFRGCRFVTPPALPATTLRGYCYSYMFMNCTNIVEAPELPATALATRCYVQMFQGCTSLNKVKLSATVYNADFFTNWLSNVAASGSISCPSSLALPTNSASGIPTGWTKVYEDTLNFKAVGGSATIAMNKYGTTTLYKSSDNANWSAWDGTAITLQEGEKVYVYGTDWYANSTNHNKFAITGNIEADGDVTTLLQYGGTTTITQTYCFAHLFYGCSGLTKTPKLPATTLTNYCYLHIFRDCTSLQYASELPATTIYQGTYAKMFEGCTSLLETPTMHVTGQAPYASMEYMFMNCTSLRKAVLTPTSTGSYAYSNIFMNCSSLNDVTVYSTDSNGFNNWLKNVAATGTLTCPSTLSLSTGNSGLPSGWTRVNL